jgi:hypothetical protein
MRAIVYPVFSLYSPEKRAGSLHKHPPDGNAGFATAHHHSFALAEPHRAAALSVPMNFTTGQWVNDHGNWKHKHEPAAPVSSSEFLD